MRFSDQAKDSVSAGRGIRYKEMEKITDVKILADVSSVEVFVNGGETVFSTRYYPGRYEIDVRSEGAEIALHSIGMSSEFPTE